MTALFEAKDAIVRFYGRHETVMNALMKFVLALAAFGTINLEIGYMSRLANIPVTLILAVLAALLPVNFIVFLGSLLVVAHLYALSLEVCAVGAAILLVIMLLYFRFTPRTGYNTVVTAVLFRLHVPYIMPVTVGLLETPAAMLSVVSGTVIYYFLAGVKENEALLSASVEDSSSVSVIAVALKQLFGNREMFLVLVTFVIMMLIIYIIRRMSIDHAWTIAFISGIITEVVILLSGYLIFGMSDRILWLVIGNIITVPIAFLLQLLFFNLDYSRIERVQFEDDEYYYYVKAVPKICMTEKEKQVTLISGSRDRDSERRTISRRELAEEMDIDEDLLD
ncbi:MAG: hypothetical protein MR355_10825 [Lachnospiraceae bacterium]|nr:hypothetical protein [Lachnospiraceae bacterium]